MTGGHAAEMMQAVQEGDNSQAVNPQKSGSGMEWKTLSR